MNEEIFSYHLASVDPLLLAHQIALPRSQVRGLKHSETMLTMRLGASIFLPSRYGLNTMVFFARWENEKFLSDFLQTSELGQVLQTGWHVRLKFYRKWGFVTELDHLPENSLNINPDAPVVGITLARLKISESLRFLKWGRPVEKLIRDHPGKTMALAAMRPRNTLSTFSIWKSEKEMIEMVQGRSALPDGNLHADAMIEQSRNSFHHEFITMRFHLLKEYGFNNFSA